MTLTLFTFLSLSRVGHWTFDLMVQEISQVEIPAAHRSTFAGTEQSFRSLFELCHWGATVVWSQPSQFRWLALGSWGVLGLAVGVFWVWSLRVPGREGETVYEEVGMVDLDLEREEG